MGQEMCHAGKPEHVCTVARPGAPPGDLPSQRDLPSALTQKGLTIWVDTVDDLIRALPFEVDVDLDHLHELPCEQPNTNPWGSGVSRSTASSGTFYGDPVRTFELPDFPRDLGIRCERASACRSENQDNFAAVQVDDVANPWALYAIADGHGPHGHLVSTLLVHELPCLLTQNPSLHKHSSLALHQAFLSVGEMAATCQFVDATVSGSTLSAVLLREGVLNVAWVGDSKAVLGRLAARPGQPDGAAGFGPQGNPLYPAGRKRPGAAPAGARGRLTQGSSNSCSPPPPSGPPPLLRAVELTSDHVTPNGAAGANRAGDPHKTVAGAGTPAAPNFEPADTAGGPPPPVQHPGLNGLARAFGNSRMRGSSGGGSMSNTPEVRRMRLKPEDVFVVLGSGGLWKHLSPTEVVTIVGQNLHRMAADAAGALLSEVHKRETPDSATEDTSVMVAYLAGSNYVTDFDLQRASHVQEYSRTLAQVREATGLARCGCLPTCNRW